MRAHWKKGLAALLAALLLLAALPLGALAAPAGETGCSLQRTVEQLGGGAAGQSQAATFLAGANASADGSLYSQLTPRQQACYDALEAIPIDQILTAAEKDGYRQVGVRIPELYGLTLTGEADGSGFTPDSASAAKEREIYTDLCAAIEALRYDRPDILWMSDMLYGYRWRRQSAGQVKTENMVFAFKLVYGGQEKAMWQQSLAAAENLAAQVDPEADLYTQVKTAHDLLAQGNTYAGDFPDGKGESLSHMAYSALLFDDGYDPVCDGYAKAFQMVCQELGIPCVLASSQTHMWNNVKMDDGEWYNLDLTWDDSGEEVSYSYFLVGSQTVVDGEVFSQQADHREKNPFQQTENLNPVTLRFPTKNTVAYQYLGEPYPPMTFPDVKPKEWYFGEVEEAAALGLFQGEDGLFQPNRNITRSEFCKVAAISQGADLSLYEGETEFTDVDPGQWYAPYVAWAADSGVMNGDGNGVFRPNDPITREEMCQVFCNLLAEDLPQVPEQEPFPDDSAISDWAKEAVYLCKALDLVRGAPDGSFAPSDFTQRCEAAAVFVRFGGLDIT